MCRSVVPYTLVDSIGMLVVLVVDPGVVVEGRVIEVEGRVDGGNGVVWAFDVEGLGLEREVVTVFGAKVVAKVVGIAVVDGMLVGIGTAGR